MTQNDNPTRYTGTTVRPLTPAHRPVSARVPRRRAWVSSPTRDSPPRS